MDSEDQTALDRRAAAAWELIKRGQDWESWLVVAEALHEGRLFAMHKVATNQPAGKNYNRAFSDWLDASERKNWTQEIDRTTRNHAIWCHENKKAIEEWREALGRAERLKINHPTTTFRNYQKLNVEKAVAKKERAKQVKINVDELDKLQADLAKYKKQAEADGSLFDLKNDTAAQIAKTIRYNVSEARLNALYKAIGVELQIARAAKKQAG